MSFDALETSQRGGVPVELYRFDWGQTRYCYTSADEDITYLGDLYTSEAVLRSSARQSGELEQGGIEIELPHTNPVVAPFLSYSPEPPIAVTVFAKHRTDPEAITVFLGSLASVTVRGAVATLQCLPLYEVLRRTVPRNTYQAQCNWALYSAQCGVLAGNHRLTAKITAINAEEIQATAFSSKPSGWFDNGWVERATGERRWIVSHVGSVVTLMSPFVGLAVNEDVFAYPGCDRTESDCKTKFSNLLNFLGFPRIPTRNPFEAGV